jgi:hypothetical protein
MNPGGLLRLGLIAVVGLLLAAPPVAADTYGSSYEGGELLVSANHELTEARIETLTFSFDGCGTEPEEATCTWEVDAVLKSAPETRCNPDTPASQRVFSSGPQSGNGSFSAAPTSFPLEGCRGQVFYLSYRFDRTYEPYEGKGPPPLFRITGGGGSLSAFTFGFHPIKEAEERIINASPPATQSPPPVPPALTISANCKSLWIGSTRYAFAFRQMGCHKAGNLARMQHLSKTAPSGYVCSRKSGGVRCWRQGKPDKYVEWARPR